MPSTFTTNTGIEKPGAGEQSGTWNVTANTSYDILDRALNGVGAISLSGISTTLTTSDGSLSDGQYRVLVFGGSPTGTNTVTIAPSDAQKLYFVLNNSGESVVITQGSGGDVTVANGRSAVVYCDGGGSGAAVVDLTAVFAAGQLFAANNLSDVSNAATAATNLGLQIGADVQAYSANLTAFLSGFTLPVSDGTSGQALTTDGAGNLDFADNTLETSSLYAYAILFG